MTETYQTISETNSVETTCVVAFMPRKPLDNEYPAC